MHSQLGRRAIFAAAILFLTCSAAAAQTISGVVTDTSGGVLPGVAVEARNAATGQLRTAVTDGSGRYVITSLQPGTYSRHLHGWTALRRPLGRESP